MTGEYTRHLGSKAEKEYPPARAAAWDAPTRAKHEVSPRGQLTQRPDQRPACRQPARLAASPGLGGAEKSCVWPQDMLFWSLPSGETTTSWTPFKQCEPKPGCARLPAGYLKLSQPITPKGRAASLP